MGKWFFGLFVLVALISFSVIGAAPVHLLPRWAVASAAPAGTYAAARERFANGDLEGTKKILESLIVPKQKVTGKELEETLKLWGVCKFLLGDYDGAEKIFGVVLRRNVDAKLQPQDILDPAILTMFEAVRMQAKDAKGNEPAEPRVRRPAAREESAQVLIQTNASKANIFANNIFVGGQDEFIPMKPGKHELLISAPGFLETRVTVTLSPGETLKKKLLLRSPNERSQADRADSSLEPQVRERTETVTVEEREVPLPERSSRAQERRSKGGGSTFLAVLPLGVGQFQNQHYIKGGLVVAGEVSALAWTLHNALRLNEFLKEEEDAAANADPADDFNPTEAEDYKEGLKNQQLLGLGLFAAVWTVGIIDALVFLDHGEKTGARLDVRPAGDGGVVVGLVCSF